MKKEEDEALAAERIAKSRWQSAKRWNKEHESVINDEEHAPGSLVLVRNTAVEKELNRKHKPRWLGPMVVIRRTLGGGYICAELSGAISKLRFAAFRLKKFVARDGLTFDVEEWLGKDVIDSVESELISAEQESRAWSLPNGDESSGEESDSDEPDGVEEAREEQRAFNRTRETQVGRRMVFDGVHLPRVPNLPKMSLHDLGLPPPPATTALAIEISRLSHGGSRSWDS
jgi:hypothetical protein